MNKAVFIDKDGTLIKNVPYNVDPDKIKLMLHAGELKKLQDRGYLIIVVSNQTGVAKGLFEEVDLIPVRKKIIQLLKEKNIILADFYYCPHDANGKIKKYKKICQDHKPQPGMLFKATKDHNIDLSHSWIIGDTIDDIQVGKRAGCKTILVSKEKNLKNAVKYIINHEIS